MQFPELSTPRLRLRPLIRQDADLLYRFNSDLDALRWIARDPFVDSAEGVAKAASYVEMQEADTARWWVFERLEDDEPVGYGGLFFIDTGNRSAEVGYGLLPPHWGRGYASEAVRAVVDVGFDALALHRLHATVSPHNPASARILEKLGFVCEGRLRHCSHARDTWFDMDVFGLLENERA